MTGDLLQERGNLFLGSRLKRLAERMQADVVHVPERAGLEIQPGQYPMLGVLDRDGPMTIGELAQTLELSQPTITRAVARLIEMGLVEASRLGRDQRHKTISLTAAGRAAMEVSKARVWPQIEAAVTEITQGLTGSLLNQITILERRLAEKPLSQRGLSAVPSGLVIREFAADLAPAFRDINSQWITAMYEMEAADREVLDDPEGKIIDPGGAILFVEAEGLGIVGTCALKKTGEGAFELIKMGVLESARGRKAGEFLLRAVIARAQTLGAKTLYLLSNKKSAAAVHLYEKLGFVHDEAIMRDYGGAYERCDVAMRYRGR
ncbi:bifunctional helix-turn-helix transcriptional regulator/GNAT family N-acetyltransferase [Phenylobacterium montanum]|uniref:Bifunctional helix-turn-helix transcriptional regulator/GNAT family N-acetyltransferase n=1 Tax=Phenylobacterium montanum TaxID=2823693 RepID=A0A975FYL4_9CAUL|nr:bifunctional helix-turn-helix transcriptional regulator/GNAT family N-acetyltransferase [Caulobacter sp. S6]QUD86696.1 bifunctional helix-turn-helix transcriptional regulator/GNAT family N-acetyltransferase [Caulobacter sp. S6]